ncbi:hypothetical protein JCM10207_002249 [Rhodosporidiobolus poonsookiae]
MDGAREPPDRRALKRMAVSSAGGGLSSHLTSVLCWTFLPSLLSNLLLNLFYRLSPSSRPSVPPRATVAQLSTATARAQAHHRRARVLLLTGYLVYSVLSVYRAQASGPAANFYTLLGLPRAVVEADGAGAVKKHWKRLARVYHPDKVGKAGEALFVALKAGVDVLSDETRRWAYERFGPGVVAWGGGKLVTRREFLKTGVVHALVFWGSALVSIFAFTFFRKSERRYNFWRYLALFLSFSLELHFLLRPTPSPTFSLLFPRRLTFEHVALLRQIFISTSMAMSQLAPLLFPSPPSSSSSDAGAGEGEDALARALADAEQLKPLLQRLAQLTATADAEAYALQQLELRPLVPVPSPSSPPSPADAAAAKERDRALRADVQRQMVRTFEDLQVKGNPATGRLWSEAVSKGREAKRARKGEGEGGKKRKGKKKQGKEAMAGAVEDGAPSSTSPAPSSPSPVPLATLDSATIPPPVTALASPPASPKPLGFPNSALPLPSPSVSPPVGVRLVEEDEEEPPVDAGRSKDTKDAKGETVEEKSRLPTPPPEVEEKA